MGCPINVFSNIVDFSVMGNFSESDSRDFWKVDLYDLEKGLKFTIDVFFHVTDLKDKTVHPRLGNEIIFETKINEGQLIEVDSILYRNISIKISAQNFAECLQISQKVLNEINLQLLKARHKKED